jgi:hypothetical protein
MTLLAESLTTQHDRSSYRGPSGVGTGPAAVSGLVLTADRSEVARDRSRTVRSWTLLLLAFPAAAEVWSGWVGIAQKTGFGLVSPLPGIWPSLHLDTTITIPVGVEAYAAYALRAWLARESWISARTAGSPSGPRSPHSPSAWPGRSPTTCWPRPGRHGRHGPSPPSCPACRSWSWPWGPRWPTCSAPTQRTRAHRAPARQDRPSRAPKTSPARAGPRATSQTTRQATDTPPGPALRPEPDGPPIRTTMPAPRQQGHVPRHRVEDGPCPPRIPPACRAREAGVTAGAAQRRGPGLQRGPERARPHDQ